MHSTISLVYLLVSLAPWAAQADLQLDDDDISPACRSICRPVRELSQICDVDDDDRVGGRVNEDNLTLQCYCLNTSFDVRTITPLCQSCMQQNPDVDDDDDDGNDDNDDGINGTDDDMADINEIVSRCGFAQATYRADQANLANPIVVAAVRPTAASQLTTTIAGGIGGATTLPTGTARTTTATTATNLTTATGTRVTGTPAATTGPTTVSGASGLGPLFGGEAMIWTYVFCAAGFGAWML
ncbi:unnamed protein product [Discula destructiva]